MSIIIVLSIWFYFILVTKKKECIKNLFKFQHYKVIFNSYLPSPLWLCPQTVPTIHADLTLPILAVDEEVEPKNIIEKLGWVCGPLPKILSLLWTKSAFFPTIVTTWPKIWYPIYDCCGWHSCSKHSFWRSYLIIIIIRMKRLWLPLKKAYWYPTLD